MAGEFLAEVQSTRFRQWIPSTKGQLPELPQSAAQTAPSGMGPLAWRESYRVNCKVSGFARGSPFGRAGTAGD